MLWYCRQTDYFMAYRCKSTTKLYRKKKQKRKKIIRKRTHEQKNIELNIYTKGLAKNNAKRHQQTPKTQHPSIVFSEHVNIREPTIKSKKKKYIFFHYVYIFFWFSLSQRLATTKTSTKAKFIKNWIQAKIRVLWNRNEEIQKAKIDKGMCLRNVLDEYKWNKCRK